MTERYALEGRSERSLGLGILLDGGSSNGRLIWMWIELAGGRAGDVVVRRRYGGRRRRRRLSIIKLKK